MDAGPPWEFLDMPCGGCTLPMALPEGAAVLWHGSGTVSGALVPRLPFVAHAGGHLCIHVHKHTCACLYAMILHAGVRVRTSGHGIYAVQVCVGPCMCSFVCCSCETKCLKPTPLICLNDLLILVTHPGRLRHSGGLLLP